MNEHPITVRTVTDTDIDAVTGANDIITRYYNKYWGALTDTHMVFCTEEGKYMITGSIVNKEFLDLISYARILPQAPHTLLPITFDDLMRANNMQCQISSKDGQPIIVITPGDLHVLTIPKPTKLTRVFNTYDPPCCDGVVGTAY
jgi:hypothetical protein